MAILAPIVTYPENPMNERVIEFLGINQRSVIADGEMRDMHNLTSADYPCLSQRKGRGTYNLDIGGRKAQKLISKRDTLGIIDTTGQFWYNHQVVAGPKFSEETKMVAINNKIVFFPEKKVYNIDTGEMRDIEKIWNYVGVVNVTDDQTTDYCDLEFANIDTIETKGFYADDGIMIECTLTYTDSHGTSHTKDFYGANAISCVVKDIKVNHMYVPYNTFLELSEAGASTGTLSHVTVKRECPDLDYLMEYNNRIWGVSNADNTIYASKLGDPTNWTYYPGTGMDSYYAEQGSDGEWTGCAAYTNHLLFFKEECIHKVYGQTPATWQIATTICHALEKGNDKSVVIINGSVIYKSKTGIMAYDGGTPILLTAKLSDMKITDVVAGTDGIKYYASVLDHGQPKMLVFDTENKLWHIEDDARARQFLYIEGKLMYINTDGDVKIIDADVPDEGEENIKWMAQLGPYHEYMENRRIYNKIRMRLTLDQDAELDVYIKIDKGEWELIQHIRDEHGQSYTVPIVPRRCDTFSIKLEGEGRCKIESCVRQFRRGSYR